MCQACFQVWRKKLQNHVEFLRMIIFAFYCRLAFHEAEKEVCGLSEIKVLEGNFDHSCNPYIVPLQIISIHICSRSHTIVKTFQESSVMRIQDRIF